MSSPHKIYFGPEVVGVKALKELTPEEVAGLSQEVKDILADCPQISPPPRTDLGR